MLTYGLTSVKVSCLIGGSEHATPSSSLQVKPSPVFGAASFCFGLALGQATCALNPPKIKNNVWNFFNIF